MERESDTVVIYDGDCPFRSAVATALRRLPAAGTVGWECTGVSRGAVR
jgi:predicted DCC family thiol-disulfide oxidoreductase YuxK